MIEAMFAVVDEFSQVILVLSDVDARNLRLGQIDLASRND
jgi:hypothetical protein